MTGKGRLAQHTTKFGNTQTSKVPVQRKPKTKKDKIRKDSGKDPKASAGGETTSIARKGAKTCITPRGARASVAGRAAKPGGSRGPQTWPPARRGKKRKSRARM